MEDQLKKIKEKNIWNDESIYQIKSKKKPMAEFDYNYKL